MNTAEMIVIIVLIVMLARVFRDRVRYRAQRPIEDSEATQALIAEVARLRDRVAVLERIATDGPTRLEQEIDSLRSSDHAALR